MVAHLLRLKLALLRNSLRRSPWQLVGVILGGLYGLSVLTGIIIGLVALGFADPAMGRTVIVLAGSGVMLGWIIVPVAAGGIDMTLDPARFVTFAVPMPQLLAGLTLGGLIGVPGLVTLLAALGTAGTWRQGIVPVLAALVCAVLAALTCVVMSRLVTSATASLASSRRFKDISGVVAFIPVILLGPIIGGAAAGLENAAGFLPSLAGTLSWTPLGAVWAVPGDLTLGNYGAAVVKLLIAVATFAVAVWLWKLNLARALVTPVHNAVSRKRGGNLGFFSRFPDTPTGAVAARALTYWLRDPRYGGSLVIIPLLPILFYFIGDASAGPLNFIGPFVAFLLAWSISADISYDSTAFSLHVSTGVSGTADRAGRLIACLVFALPTTLVFTIVPLWITGSWQLLPGMLGLAVGLLLTGLGLSSVVSARYTYNVPLPGDSPFKTPPGSGVRMMVVQLAGWALLLVLAVPELALAIISFVTGTVLYGWFALAAGLVLGSVLMVAGVRIGGRWYDTRAPELLLAVERNK